MAGVITSAEAALAVGSSTRKRVDYTPLMVASMEGDSKNVEELLNTLRQDPTRFGYSVNAQNTQGESALLLAIKANHHDVVQLLLCNGAKVNIMSRTGDTPLSLVRLQCRSMAKRTGKRCPINWDLNDDQLCEFHATPSSDGKPMTNSDGSPDTKQRVQCRGTAKSTGRRCPINWDLNDDQLCEFHATPSSDGKPMTNSDGSPDTKQRVQCRGTAKSTGRRCPINWDLNDDQLCEFHATPSSDGKPMTNSDGSPDTKQRVQCRGTAKSTGRRCRIDWDLNDDQLCEFHKNEAPSVTGDLIGYHDRHMKYCEYTIKLMTDANASPTPRELLLSPTSVYDLSSMVTLVALLKLPKDTASSLMLSAFNSITTRSLVVDKNTIAFFCAALRHCVNIQLISADESSRLSSLVSSLSEEPTRFDSVKYVESLMKCFNSASSRTRQRREAVVVLSQRVKNLRCELKAGYILLDCLQSRGRHSSLPEVKVLERRLADAESRIDYELFDPEKLPLQPSVDFASRVVAAVASFVFPPHLSEVAPEVVQLSDPVDIVTHIYKEADVALFLAGNSTKELPLCIKTELEQHCIAPDEFKILLREAVASTHPQYVEECARRHFNLDVDGGRFEAASACIPALEREEETMLDLLCELLAAAEAVAGYRYRHKGSVNFSPVERGIIDEVANEVDEACEDSVHRHHEGSAPSGRNRFRGFVRGIRRRFSSRVTPSGTSRDEASERENETTTYATALTVSICEPETVWYCKVCVLGPGSSEFVRCLTGRAPRRHDRSDTTGSNGHFEVSDWNFEDKDISADDVARKYKVALWNFPNDKAYEAVSAQCLSEAALYVVCADFERGAPEIDQLRWICLVRARDPSAQILIVDTSQVKSETSCSAASRFQSLCEKLQRDYHDSVRDDLLRAEASVEISATDPRNLPLSELIRQLRQLLNQTQPLRCIHLRSDKIECDLKATIVNSRRTVPMDASQLEIADSLRSIESHNGITDDTPDEKIMAIVTERNTLCARLMTRWPSVGKQRIEGTLDILHNLGEIFCFEGETAGRLNGHVCTDMRFWLQYLFEAMRGSSHHKGRFVHDVNAPSLWKDIRDANSTYRAKELLATSLLAFPSSSKLHWNSNLVFPQFLSSPDDSLAAAPLVLPDSRPETPSFSWIRKFIFRQEPPVCLVTHMIVACHNKMRNIVYQHQDQADGNKPAQDKQHELAFQWECTSNCLKCVFGKDFIVRLSVAQAAGMTTAQLEVLGAQQKQIHRDIFQTVAGTVEAVLDMYPGLWVTRKDATWMPTEWTLEDMARHIERRPPVREALAIEETLYVDKICIVGPRNSGKTTLTKSLTSNTPSLVHPKERTVRIDLAEGYFLERDESRMVARRHAVTICDFVGHAKYQAAQTLFFPYATMFFLCVDLHAYGMALEQAHFMTDDEKSEKKLMHRFVSQNILRWIDKIYLASRDVTLVLVATKADVLRHDARKIDRIRTHLFEKLKVHALKHSDDIRKRLNQLLVPGTFDTRHNETGSSNWLVVSCKTQASVAHAQQHIEKAIVSAKRSAFLPNAYARIFTSISTLRENIRRQDPKDRAVSTILTSQQLSSLLQNAVPSFVDETQANILTFLHCIGDIVRYGDFRVRELQADKAILEPRLLIDFAWEIFKHKSPGEKLTHMELENRDAFPLWASFAEKPEKFEMKLIMRALRIVRQTHGEMVEDSDLLVPAYAKRLITYGNAHVGPLYRRYVRSPSSTHELHVLWKFYLGKILDERFFERLVEYSYSVHEKRVVYNGLVKFTADDSRDGETYGKTERRFCQVWIDQKDQDGRYIVSVEAVAGSAGESEIWDPFGRICVAIERSLKDCPHESPCHLYAVQTIQNGQTMEEHEHKVKDTIINLWSGPSRRGGSRTLTWMPPVLEWYVDNLEMLSDCLTQHKIK